jgi:hypothetical protein
MKIIIILALLALTSCVKESSKENIQNNNKLKGQTYRGKTILGYWHNINDNSSLEFYDNVMYLYSDTLQHLFNWDIVNRSIVIQSYDLVPQRNYSFSIRNLTDSMLIIYTNKMSYYKLIWRF